MRDAPTQRRPEVFGVKIPKSDYTDGRSVLVVDPEPTAAGNVIIRAGHEAQFGWERSEHVVLTPDEAPELLRELAQAIGGYAIVPVAIVEQAAKLAEWATGEACARSHGEREIALEDRRAKLTRDLTDALEQVGADA